MTKPGIESTCMELVTSMITRGQKWKKRGYTVAQIVRNLPHRGVGSYIIRTDEKNPRTVYKIVKIRTRGNGRFSRVFAREYAIGTDEIVRGVSRLPDVNKRGTYRCLPDDWVRERIERRQNVQRYWEDIIRQDDLASQDQL